MGNINDKGFYNSDKLGKIGERRYLEKLEELKQSGKIRNYVDLRENDLCRLADIDVAVITGNKDYSIDEIEKMILTRRHNKNCCLIDVKTDSVVLTSGNIFLEWIAHNVPGCFGSTHADKWIYYGIDNQFQLKKVWSIDLKTLRSLITSEEINLQNCNANYCKKEGRENFAYRININTLIEKKAAKEIDVL
jgi:hypothetical protein